MGLNLVVLQAHHFGEKEGAGELLGRLELAVDAAGSPVELQAQLLMDVGAYALMTGDHPAALRAQDAVVRLARSHRMYTTGTTALNNACEIGLELGTSPR